MTQSLPLDLKHVRALFPAFSDTALARQVFLDNAAGSYTAQAVLDRLDHFYRAHKVQPYGVYPASIAAGEMMDKSYAQIAAALNLPNDWVHFGSSTSANSYVLGKAFAEHLQQGDAIIVTNQDHEANSGAWRKLEKQGIEVHEWQVDASTGHLDPNDLAQMLSRLSDKIRLVAFPHCSNIVGEINPARYICDLIRSAGAISVVDGVSYAPHGLPDLAEMGCDIYLFSTYKTYGPHLGVMAIEPDLARSLPNQGHFFNDAKLRYRLTPAGPDHAQIGAVGGVITYLEQLAEISGGKGDPCRLAHDAMRTQETIIMAPLIDFLSHRNNVRMIGPTDPHLRAPTIAISHEKPGIELATTLAQHGIMAAGGHFYAYRLLEALNIDPGHGVLRLSMTHYTSPEDVSRTIEALEQVL